MRGLLLDTNIVVSLINDKTISLPKRLCAEAEAPSVQHFVSVASIWEIAIKANLGKLRVDVPAEGIERALVDAGILVLPIVIDHAVTVADPVPDTKDPFDRLLLAICAVEDLRLMTTDKALGEHRLAY